MRYKFFFDARSARDDEHMADNLAWALERFFNDRGLTRLTVAHADPGESLTGPPTRLTVHDAAHRIVDVLRASSTSSHLFLQERGLFIVASADCVHDHSELHVECTGGLSAICRLGEARALRSTRGPRRFTALGRVLGAIPLVWHLDAEPRLELLLTEARQGAPIPKAGRVLRRWLMIDLGELGENVTWLANELPAGAQGILDWAEPIVRSAAVGLLREETKARSLKPVRSSLAGVAETMGWAVEVHYRVPRSAGVGDARPSVDVAYLAIGFGPRATEAGILDTEYGAALGGCELLEEGPRELLYAWNAPGDRGGDFDRYFIRRQGTAR